MKKVVFFLSVVFGLGWFQLSYAQDASSSSEKPYVHCVLLDKTYSMVGKATGATDIWSDVVDYCTGWIEGVPQSSIVLLFTYDKDLQGPKVFTINAETDRDDYRQAVKDIIVNGRHTWIAKNLQGALEYLKQNYGANPSRIYLITDGIEEQPGVSASTFVDKFNSYRGDYDKLYYVDLRGLASEEIKNKCDSSGVVIGKGEIKEMVVAPQFGVINFIQGASTSFEQVFDISKGEELPDCTFDVEVDAQSGLVVYPSKDISFSQMTKLDNKRYRMTFNVVCNNLSDGEVAITLRGHQVGDDKLSFKPDQFVLKITKKEEPKPEIVEVIGDGWSEE